METRSISVDQHFINKGNSILNRLWDKARSADAVTSCMIEECITSVLINNNTKTYKYILLTQLLGKAIDESVNILAMETNSDLEGSWSARNLCEAVITRGGFEKNVLKNILGASKQPYNNAPGQWPSLSKENSTRKSDIPLRDMIIDNLKLIETSHQAEEAIEYAFVLLSEEIKKKEQADSGIKFAQSQMDLAIASNVLNKISHLGKNGEGLSLATAMLLKATVFEETGLIPKLYKVNASSKNRGDLDLIDGDSRFATFELKDKPFTPDEVIEYAEKAWTEKCPRFYFVFGPNSGGAPSTIFSEEYRKTLVGRGMTAFCVSFEALLASLLLSRKTIDLNSLKESCDYFGMDALIKPEVTNVANEYLREAAVCQLAQIDH